MATCDLLRDAMMLRTADPLLERDGVKIHVVRSIDELICVTTLRARIFQHEQDCPYREEFDGNDLSGATHLLALRGDEPVGTIRLRWFANFMKAERVAVIQKERSISVAFALIYGACIFSQKKGYTTMLGHAERRVAKLWDKTGIAKTRKMRDSFTFSGIEFVEVLCDIPATIDRLSIDTPALVLNRPEGEWDEPGVLEVEAAA